VIVYLPIIVILMIITHGKILALLLPIVLACLLMGLVSDR
jgi:hypothetical protein